MNRSKAPVSGPGAESRAKSSKWVHISTARTVPPPVSCARASRAGSHGHSLPQDPQFHSGRLGPTLVCVTVGGSLIAVALLVMLIRRARRGGYRPRAGMWLRILTPLPLGLGGWFLAVLDRRSGGTCWC